MIKTHSKGKPALLSMTKVNHMPEGHRLTVLSFNMFNSHLEKVALVHTVITKGFRHIKGPSQQMRKFSVLTPRCHFQAAIMS